MQKTTHFRLSLLTAFALAMAVLLSAAPATAQQPAELPLDVQISDLPPVDCDTPSQDATPIATLIEETRAPMSVETTEDIMNQKIFTQAGCSVFYYCCGSDCGGYGRGCKATCCGYSCDVTLTQLCC